MVSSIFEVIGSAVTSFSTALASAVTSITAMFYTTETGPTFLGTLLLIASGVGLVYWAFNLIRRLVKRA